VADTRLSYSVLRHLLTFSVSTPIGNGGIKGTRKTGYTRKKAVAYPAPWPVWFKKPPITRLPAVTNSNSSTQRQSPLVGRGFQGTLVRLPAPGTWWAAKPTNLTPSRSGFDIFCGTPQSHLCVTTHHVYQRSISTRYKRKVSV
jgi:hypothetical protein